VAERRVRWAFWVLLGLIIAAWGLRLYRLDAQSLWYDEGVTAQVVRQGLTGLTRWTADDIQPPLYYYIVAGWVRLAGASEWALRFPSAAWGVLIVPLIYALGRRLYGTMAGLLAALLVGGAPLYVYYSQEARMYTQLTALGLVVTYVLVRALQTGDDHARQRWWAAFAIAGLAAVYTHYFAFFLLVALALATAASFVLRPPLAVSHQPSAISHQPSATHDPSSIIRRSASCILHLAAEPILAVAVILVGYLPWLPFVFHRYQVDASYWQGQLKPGEALRHVWINFTLGAPQTTLERDAVRIGWGFAVVAALALVGLLCRGRRTVWATMVLLSYLLVPVVLILILSSRTPKFNPRYLMLASPAFWLLIATGLNTLIHPRSSLNPRSSPGPTAETAPHAAGGATVHENPFPPGVIPRSAVCDEESPPSQRWSLSWPSACPGPSPWGRHRGQGL